MRITVRIGLGIAGLALLTAAKEPAAAPTAESVAAMPDADLVTNYRKLAAKDPRTPDALCLISLYSTELAKRRNSSELSSAAALQRGMCSYAKGALKEALAEFEQAEGLSPVGAEWRLRGEIDSLAISAAVDAKDWNAFSEHALHVVNRKAPDEYARLNRRFWSYALNQSGKAHAGPIAVAFLDSEAFDALPEALQISIIYRGIKPLIAQGDFQKAADAAQRWPNPYSSIRMLIDHDYQAIWPQLEAFVGPRNQKVSAAYLERARADRSANPNDDEKLSELVLASLMNGDYAGAIAVAAALDHSSKAIERASEHKIWALNYEAWALDRLGRQTEADAIFEKIGTLSPQGRGWVVNFAVNRAERLVALGLWRRALPAAELAVQVAAENGSPYAQAAAAADRYCAAIKLNPARAELPAWWAEIEKGWKANSSSAVQAALCKEDIPSARRFIAEGLVDPDTRESILTLLQPEGFSLFRDTPGVTGNPATLLDGDPDLKALFDKYGRTLPAALMPNAAR